MPSHQQRQWQAYGSNLDFHSCGWYLSRTCSIWYRATSSATLRPSQARGEISINSQTVLLLNFICAIQPVT